MSVCVYKPATYKISSQRDLSVFLRLCAFMIHHMQNKISPQSDLSVFLRLCVLMIHHTQNLTQV